MSNAAFQYEQQHFELKILVSLGIDAMTVLGKTSQLISVESKDKLKPRLNEDTRSLCDNDHTTSDYLFGENMSENVKLAMENYKLAQNLANSKFTPRYKSSGSSYRAGYKRRYDAEALSIHSSSTRTSLTCQIWKKTFSSSKLRRRKFKKN